MEDGSQDVAALRTLASEACGSAIKIIETAEVEIGRAIPPRNAGAECTIEYRSQNDARRDNHIVAHELTHILRWFSPGANGIREVRFTGGPQMALRGEYRTLVYLAYNCPRDLRIEDFLRSQYPGLREGQMLNYEDWIHGLSKSLQSGYGQGSPLTAVRANLAMNAAFARGLAIIMDRKDWAEMWRDEKLPEGVPQLASKLSESLEALPPDGSHDEKLVEAWANIVGLRRFFVWESV